MNESTIAVADQFLTLREAAQVLKLHPRTLRQYLRRGQIEGRLIGGRWRFRRANLDRFYDDSPTSWDTVGKFDHGN
jgi:excisionase family DNA binding protein